MMGGVMSLIAELRQALYDLPLASKPSRKVVAHFCEHDGIRIEFTRARTTWHAMSPSAVKPWWMILEPLIDRHRSTDEHTNNNPSDKTDTNDKKKKAVEVLEDA
jgi:hypothetical protein